MKLQFAGILFAGDVRSWWPYLIHSEPERAERYRGMVGRTTAFLPVCNGIVPNTRHTILHASTAVTLVVLALRTIHYSPGTAPILPAVANRPSQGQ